MLTVIVKSMRRFVESSSIQRSLTPCRHQAPVISIIHLISGEDWVVDYVSFHWRNVKYLFLLAFNSKISSIVKLLTDRYTAALWMIVGLLLWKSRLQPNMKHVETSGKTQKIIIFLIKSKLNRSYISPPLIRHNPRLVPALAVEWLGPDIWFQLFPSCDHFMTFV